MFYLTLIEHNLPLPPHLLNLPIEDAIKDQLENLFLNKVIAKLGLCVAVYDIRSIDDGFIYPGEGHCSYTVKFRLVMFKPFVGEVIVGKIESSHEYGLQVSLGFFNDIRIPKHMLMQPCTRGADGIWVWSYGDGGEDSEYPLSINEEIRFRVSNVKFPPLPLEQSENSKPFTTMEIIGDINGDGLGLISWW